MSSPIIISSLSLIIVILCIYNGRTNYRANDRFAEELAQSLFDVVEQDAVLVPYGDAYIIPTAYYHLVEGKRPDIRLLEPGGFLLNDRIAQPSWSKKQKSIAWRKFVSNTDRPFYYKNIGTSLSEQTGISIIPFVRKVNSSMAPGSMTIEKSDLAKQFFKKMIAFPKTRDRWTMNTRNTIIESYGLYLGYLIVYNNSVMNNYIKDVLPLAENNYWSLIIMADVLLGYPEHISTAEKYLKKAKLLGDDQRSKSDIAYEFCLEGVIAMKKGNSHKARNLFRKSIKISPKKSNPSYKALKELWK